MEPITLREIIGLVRSRGQIYGSYQADDATLTTEINQSLGTFASRYRQSESLPSRFRTVIQTILDSEHVPLPTRWSAIHKVERLDGSEWRDALRLTVSSDVSDDQRSSQAVPGYWLLRSNRMLIRPFGKGNREIRVSYDTNFPKMIDIGDEIELPAEGIDVIVYRTLARSHPDYSRRDRHVRDLGEAILNFDKWRSEQTGASKSFDSYLGPRPSTIEPGQVIG